MKYLVEAIIPATVVRVFEVEATSEEEALTHYLKGEAYEVGGTTTTHDDDVVFDIKEIK